MSEKRFTLDDEENGLCRCILVDGEEMPTCEICELLNEQQDQISKLQANVEYLIDSKKGLIEKIGEQQATISALNEENIELKKLRKYCAEWMGVKEENLYDVVR